MTRPSSGLHELMSRAERRYASDGIPEMVMGGVSICWGLALVAPWRGWAAWFALIVSGVAGQWLIPRLKARWTAARTGYIEPRRPGKWRLAFGAAAGFGCTLLIALLTRMGGEPKTLFVPAYGLLLSGALVIAYALGRAPSGIALAAVCTGISLLLWAFPVDIDYGLSCLLVGLGASSMAAGAWRFSAYLRAHPGDQHG